MTASTSHHLRVSQSDHWIKDLSFKCLHLEFKISGDVGWCNAAKKDQTEVQPPVLVLCATCGGGIGKLLSVVTLCLWEWDGRAGVNVFSISRCLFDVFVIASEDRFFFCLSSIAQQTFSCGISNHYRLIPPRSWSRPAPAPFGVSHRDHSTHAATFKML